jgi:hypothetical protein
MGGSAAFPWSAKGKGKCFFSLEESQKSLLPNQDRRTNIDDQFPPLTFEMHQLG